MITLRFTFSCVTECHRFANFFNACFISAAIATLGSEDFWNSGHSVKGLRFSDNTNALWFPPRFYKLSPYNPAATGGEQSQFLTLWDLDGSFGGGPGYMVANTTEILPPEPRNCTFNTQWNAYKCPGTCYRTIEINYPEPGFSSTPENINYTRGNFSSLQITRLSDGQVLVLDGNLKKRNTAPPVMREFSAVLLAGQKYSITIIPSTNAPTFAPTMMRARFRENAVTCGGGMTFQFPSQTSVSWVTTNTNGVFYRFLL